MRFVKSLLLVCVIAVVGCDTGPVADTTVKEDPLNNTIKAMLEGVVSSGSTAQASELRSYITEDMTAVDEAKSAELAKDLDELEAMTSPAEIKAKAQAMIDKL